MGGVVRWMGVVGWRWLGGWLDHRLIAIIALVNKAISCQSID